MNESIFMEGRSVMMGQQSYYLMIRVKPNNGHLIDETKTKLAQLNVTNFNFSMIKMLTKFVNLVDKIGNLGGVISTEDQAFHFW